MKIVITLICAGVAGGIVFVAMTWLGRRRGYINGPSADPLAPFVVPMTFKSDQTERDAHHGDDYEGNHRWGPWSDPYEAWVNGPDGPHEMWQHRSCQCGNDDYRRVPA